jgi:hypothetical protein
VQEVGFIFKIIEGRRSTKYKIAFYTLQLYVNTSYFVLYILMLVISVVETCSCEYCYFGKLSNAFIGSDIFLSGGRTTLICRFVSKMSSSYPSINSDRNVVSISTIVINRARVFGKEYIAGAASAE